MSGADPTNDAPPAERRFRVRARHEDAHHARLLAEPDSHAAALAYVEHLTALPDELTEISIVVHDIETGHEQSFRIHVDPPEPRPRTKTPRAR